MFTFFCQEKIAIQENMFLLGPSMHGHPGIFFQMEITVCLAACKNNQRAQDA